MSDNYLRYPDVHGDEIVFVADDDLWLAPLAGGTAWRLTNDQAPVANPRFSPDGTKIAWNSEVDGKGDVYVLDRETGEVRRLTYWNAAPALARVAGWLDDAQVVVACPDDGNHALDVRLRAIGLDGSSHRLLGYGTAMALARHGSGAVAISTPNWRDLSAWKRYRGGTAPKIWLDPSGAGEWLRVLPDETAGCYSPGFFGDRLFFASDIGELADLPQSQLWSVDLAGGDLRQHTSHGGDEGYVRDPVTDGTTIVYHARGIIYELTSLDAEPRALAIELPTRRRRVRVAEVDQVGALQPDQQANGSVLEWRGAAYYLTHRGGPARALCEVPGVRVREVCLLGETGEVAYVRDDDNIDQIEIAKLDGSAEPRRLDASGLGYVVALVATPAGDTLGMVSHDGRVSLVEVASGTVTTVQETSNGEPLHPAFSPNGRYLAWRDPRGDEGDHGAIRVCDRQSGNRVFDLTSGLFNDTSPAFSADGKYLAFLSDRVFDPVYNAHDFDLSFGDSTRPYLLPLRADEPVPFGPSADGWPIGEVVKAAAAEASDQPGDASDDEQPAKVSCQIDEEGLFDRAVPLPVPVGNLSELRAAKDGVLWLKAPPTPGELGVSRSGVDDPAPRPSLERYSFTARKAETIVEALDGYRVSGDGAHIVYRDEDKWFVAPADRKVEEKDPMLVAIDTSRLRRDIDLVAEWGQMLRETHRLMTDNFWRDDLDGVDWDAMLTRYAPLVRRAASRDDVVDISWEMVGELNTGHAYIRPEARKPGQRQAGRLGADLARQDDGSYLIERILPGEPSDPRANSPLLAAGVAARAGDRIVAVNGRRLDASNSLGELLAGSAGKVVELVLAREDAQRRVAVVPIEAETRLRYHAWVASRRAYVDEHSGGRLGYVHIPDMMAEGWAQFYRDIHEATRREGVVVDVRFNGGGHTSQLIIEKLSRKVLGWDVSRWYTEPLSYPADAIRGSLVLVTNQFAGSDGDIVNAAAQELKLGPVIGERTWGGVIGIDSRYPLVDGAMVNQPRYAFHFNTAGWGVENHGIDPDIEVIMSPADWDDPEVDVQLDAAIAESFRQLEERPALRPPEGYPPPRVG